MKYMKEIAKDILGMVIFNPHMLGQKYDIFFFQLFFKKFILRINVFLFAFNK